MKTVVVTGGAGYIGSHIVRLFAEKGWRVISLDRRGTFGFQNDRIHEHITDIRQTEAFEAIFEQYMPLDCVIHCAGELGIARSYEETPLFYSQNVYATETLLNVMVKYGVRKLLYSSSAAVYPQSNTPLQESEPLEPRAMSPYSFTKYICEEKLKLMAELMGLDFVSFRYFNVVGCDTKDAQSVQKYLSIPNLIPALVRAAANGSAIRINGSDYDTPDGTCIRDYVDVRALAQLHFLACEAICAPAWKKEYNGIYNAGSGQGFSVEEMIRLFESATNCRIDRTYAPRRMGDAPYLCANISKTKSVFSWVPDMSLSELFCGLWNHHKL